MKYRIKEYDPVNDIWILQKRFLRFFWIGVSAGSKSKLEAFVNSNR